jgi:hypothetical protein
VVFGVPYLPLSQADLSSRLVKRWLEQIDGAHANCLAWCFPRKTRRLEAEDGYIYPGVALIASAVA